jgi:ATP-binding cassette subfamily B protein
VKIVSYLKGSIASVAVILLLLIVQAACDLSLPSITSDIVDVGIMQGGISDSIPVEIRPQALKLIELVSTEDDAETISEFYEENEKGNYELTAKNSEDLEELKDIFEPSIMFLAQMLGSGETDMTQLLQQADSGAVSKEQLLAQKGSMLAAASEMPFGADQAAVQFVKSEYEAVGLDLMKIQMDYMIAAGAKMLALAFISVAAAVIVTLIASYTAAKIGKGIRERIFSKTLAFSNEEMDRFTAASLITRSTNDIQQIQMTLAIFMRMVLYAPVIGIGGIIRVAGTRTGMGWIVAAAVGVMLAVVIGLMNFTMPKFKILQTLVDKLNLVSREILTGLPVIRAFSRQKHEEERFDKANKELMETQLFTNRAMSMMMPILMILMNMITIAIVWFGAAEIDLGNLQVGDMMAFITYTMQIVMSFMMLSMISIMLPRANVAAERVEEVLNAKPSIEDAPEMLREDHGIWRGEVAFKDVSFSFASAEEDVLKHVSFTASPGKTTAIIGSTGSGKSTLVNLIPRLYDVKSGRVEIDGIDVRQISQKNLRSLMGVVPQKGILFSGSIQSNIKFGNESLSDEEVRKAAEIAQAEDFISAKEDGFLSEISQGGANVSGGQKQRLAIARAIAKKPKIFIFDDSFSALDYKTDVALRRALHESVADSTVIIVAQRISTILHADQIIVLDQGEVAGIGSHAELMESCETYGEIARSQLSGRELGIKDVISK